MRSVLLGGLALAAAACERRPPPWLEEMAVKIRDELAVVNPSDGIDKVEAVNIASHYVSEYIIGCGGVDEPTKHGDRWKFGVRTGYAGSRSDWVIAVDSHTGAVWADGLRRFPDLATFRTVIVQDFVRRRM
jgi:hypothetical protein